MDKFGLVEIFAKYLNSAFSENAEKAVREIAAPGIDDAAALSYLAAEFGGLDAGGADRETFMRYFPLCVKKLDAKDYISDPYYKNVRFDGKTDANCRLCTKKYNPYESFVYDDLTENFDGTIIPHIGFFDKEFYYPAVEEDGKIWMTVTPNEINTMKEPVKKARGNVLTFGLGLGYFAYSCAIKSEVGSVTAVERNPAIIRLFESLILPQIPCGEKIRIVCADAFDYISDMPKDFDFAFVDVWRDVSDGAPLYTKFKRYENNYPETEFSYWIEKSIGFYL